MRVPAGGGTATPLFTGSPSIAVDSIAVDSESVYWANAGTPPNYSDGTVMKLTPK